MIPLLLDALAAYRLTRLITADTILDGPRDEFVWRAYRAAGRDGEVNVHSPDWHGWSDFALSEDDPPNPAAGILCRFCVGVWVGFGVVIARRLFPRAWPPIAEALALSAGAALIAGLED